MEKWIFENGVKNTSVDDKALMSFWAYELSILLGMISFFDKEERQKEYHNLKEYKWIFNYTLNPKVRFIRRIMQIIGFRFTTKILGIFLHSKLR